MREWLIGEELICGTVVGYYLLAEDCGTQGERYGVRVQRDREEETVRGITWSQRSIQALLAALMRGTVTPVALRDVVDDWLLT